MVFGSFIDISRENWLFYDFLSAEKAEN